MNEILPDEREAKLPAWVRSTLIELRNKVAEQDKLLAIAQEKARNDGCTGKVIAEGLMTKGFPLHDRAMVTFHLPNGKIDCMLRESGTLLDINASPSGLVIHPRASNSVFLSVWDQ